MDERELTPRGGEGGWLWLALGCGGLLLAGLCLVPPAFVFLGWQTGETAIEPVVGPAIDPAIDPAIEPPGSPDPMAPVVPRGAGPQMPAPPDTAPTSTRTVTVRITDSNVTGVQTGSSCSFPVGRHSRPDGTFWCRAEITCGGRVLYGDADAGYFDCTLYEQPERHVVGEDFNTTSGDRDPAMRLDTLRAELEVRDDASGSLGAFRVRATVTEVR